MKFLQQLKPLLETHETAVEDKLDESSVIRALDQFRRYTIRDIADFAFLHFLVLYILQDDFEGAVVVKGHAKRTLQNVDFKKLSFVGTDLYVYVHLLLGHNQDKLKQTPANALFDQRNHLQERDVKTLLRDMANGHRDEAKEVRFLLALEKNLQIDTANYRSCRRLVAYWNEQETYNQKLVITRILLALRSRTPNSDLLPHLEAYAKRKQFELKKVKNPEKHDESK
ncbi:hypothetical protein D3C87_482650 [compost metagenome]